MLFSDTVGFISDLPVQVIEKHVQLVCADCFILVADAVYFFS